ncbi:MAG: DNA gyrase inhibitor YacG [Nitrospirota bacterium]|nr:DNA gyrase inhibitor YacG [Nitrospirota bacterium]MDE3225775.1 DNA gyrase inhibitor YacG [Nitrospirota bacterium]MDE3242279.1 DNA gyrase inhibitor YacG [Nitrospirota bacterium]
MRQRPCPICKKPVPWEGNTWRPFCSERCQLIDLGTWAGEGYRIPGPSFLVNSSEPAEPEDEEGNQRA